MIPAFTLHDKSSIHIDSAAELLPALLPAGRVVVVTDATIDRLYAPLIAPYDRLLVGTGESIKTLDTVGMLYRRLISLGADRHTFILGVGGGIVTDIAGFLASTYMRGVRFGFVPTTLLGQVDASVGGKNGVNVDGYKNMAGCFAQPEFVICDPELLRTLPEREFRAGLAEVVKAAVIADPLLFARLERSSFGELRSDAALLGGVVRAAIGVKVGIVARDEREAGERRKLNLGHTLGHAIEKCSRQMNHGEAVAVGMALVADLAVTQGVMPPADRDRLRALLQHLGFVLTPPVELRRLLQVVSRDKKSEEGMLHLVLPAALGRCEVRPVSLGLLREQLLAL